MDCLKIKKYFAGYLKNKRYKEHAIRFNVANDVYKERSKNIREWFTTDGIYASTHDLISKILMYDVDGDRSLVVADKDFVKIAERNMNGIVPLYYNMRKAEPTELNCKTIYSGLIAAFTGGKTGSHRLCKKIMLSK